MSIDKELREELRQAARSIQVPPELYGRVHQSYQDVIKSKKGRSLLKKRILTGIVAAVILIPSAAFAASYLADDLFGSPSVIEHHGGTQDDYQAIEGMLQEARGKLSEEDFTAYMELMKQMVALKLKMADENGVTDEDKLTSEEQQQYEELISKLAPYVEKLEGVAQP